LTRHDGTAAPRDERADRLLLAIDTAGSACSVAVGRGGIVLAAERQTLRHGHAEALLPMIDRVIAAAGLEPAALDIIAAAVGPGGFTGIRVGLGAARGIVLALPARAIGVTSFAAVAATLAGDPHRPDVLLVALDSRREDFYVQLYDRRTVTPLAAPQAVLPDALAGYVAAAIGTAPLLIAGDMAEAAVKALGQRAGIEIAAGSAPDATGVLTAAWRQVESDPAGNPLRPLYLRPPDVSLPKRSAPLAAARP
jgi:tRNA threonylcarbamoyladenosine biosynthesis protein TsaB